jgi:hypothetical protein
MTKELNQDIKDHFKWLVGRLTDEGYELKQVTNLLKQELTNVSNNTIVDLHLGEVHYKEIAKVTGYSHPFISTVITNYWNSKSIGFKEKAK